MNNNETSNNANPIGLYRDPESGQYIGALEEVQADAFVRVGFKLVKPGRDAAMTSETELQQLLSGPDPDRETAQTSKKGK